MKKKVIVTGILAFSLMAPIYAQPHRGPHPERPHCCSGCSCDSNRPDERPPRDKGERPSSITDKLIKKLELTDDQVTQLKEEEKAFMEKMQQMHPKKDNEEQVSHEEMREKMESMMTEHDEAVKKILSEKQYKLYQKYMKDNRPKGPRGPRGEGPDGPEEGPDGPGGPEGGPDGGPDWMD